MNPDINGLARLEERLGYAFQDLQLLKTALTHKSFINENPGLAGENNERLEFLGDSVLSLIVSNHLYKKFPNLREGELSKIRANLVNESSLANVAGGLGLGAYLYLGKGEEGTGGREKASLLSDALEAVIAGIYLDQGIRRAAQVVLKHFGDLIRTVVEQKDPFDYKTTFQEVCQERFGVLPEYHLSWASGPDHDRVFVMEISVNGEILGEGQGKSKKEAQQRAACQALERCKRRTKKKAPAGRRKEG
jgi:ribonuclease III